MPDFYDSQNDHIKEIITAMFEKYTDLGYSIICKTQLIYYFRKICPDNK